MSSEVMDLGNGNYMVTAAAAPARGGAAGAADVAYKEAKKFCATKFPGTHAVVNEAADRDVYQGAVSGSGGSFSGGAFAAGNAKLSFHCAK